MRPYIVRPGESLSAIASANQFDAEAVWRDPRNADLRESRGDPSFLTAGDILSIPSARPQAHEIDIGQENSFLHNAVEAEASSDMDFASCAMTIWYGGGLTLTNQGPWVLVQSPSLLIRGSVVFALDKTPKDVRFNVGFVQNLVMSDGFVATYVTDDGKTMTRKQYYTKVPVRDGDPNTAPWYGPEAVRLGLDPHGKGTGSDDQPDMKDRPQTAVMWEIDTGTNDNRAKLSKCQGTDVFCSWLAVQRSDTGAIAWKCWALWVVDWSAEFDFKKRSEKEGFARQTGAGGLVRGEGSGQGAFTPVTGNPVANAVKASKTE